MLQYKKPLLLLCTCLLAALFLKAQSAVDYFSALSSNVYSQKITDIKNRPIPAMYADKKEQKTYADIIKDRNTELAKNFEDDRVVYDTVLLQKCKSIIQRLKAANSQYNFDSISVYISRSCVANASCYGEGTLFVNLGLFLWIDNDDELALVIGHELSHQFLNHQESIIKKNIALLSSDDFKDEMKAIKKSSDGKYERYKNLMKSLVTQTGKHSRYKESEADSLGMELVKNAGYNVKDAAAVLLKLDHVEDIFTSDKLYNVQAAFAGSGVDSFVFHAPPKYHGLSMANVTMNADKDFDSVKTHPDCVVRYKQLLHDAAQVPVPGCCSNLTAAYKNIKERALIETVRYQYEANNLTLCIHFCLFALQNGYTDPFYTYFLSLCFSKIYEADKHMEKFTATHEGAKAGSTLKELQDLIFNANSNTLAVISLYFLNKAGTNNTDDQAFAQLMYNTEIKAQDATAARSGFTGKYPASKYNYLIKTKPTSK